MGNVGVMELLIIPFALILYGIPVAGFVLAILAFRRVKALEAKVAELISKATRENGSA